MTSKYRMSFREIPEATKVLREGNEDNLFIRNHLHQAREEMPKNNKDIICHGFLYVIDSSLSQPYS